jgi:hypothetical protein
MLLRPPILTLSQPEGRFYVPRFLMGEPAQKTVRSQRIHVRFGPNRGFLRDFTVCANTLVTGNLPPVGGNLQVTAGFLGFTLIGYCLTFKTPSFAGRPQKPIYDCCGRNSARTPRARSQGSIYRDWTRFCRRILSSLCRWIWREEFCPEMAESRPSCRFC